MNKNLIVRSLAAVSGLAMLASLAACGDNVAATTDSTSTKDLSSQISGDYAGAGASSQQAAVEAWIAGFKGSNPDAKIAYNPSGSGAGVTTFLQGATAWAGSDKALADDEVEQSKNVCAKGTAFDVPVYVSPIAVVFNLKGVSDQGKHVNMDASTIAKIFDGKITKWNDAAIKSQNPKLNLPDTDITVVHRSDKSGTTVKQADGTIGYADFSQVGELGTVAVKVGSKYTEISADAGSKVIEDSELADVKGEHRVVVNINHKTEADGAYPIVLVSYDIVCPAYKDTKTAEFAKSWLSYVTSDEGQKTAQQAAGTAPLPSTLTSKIADSIKAISTK